MHGNNIIEINKGYPLADGQWTRQKNQALVIKTADCLPVFLWDGKTAMALHIGWRGFVNNIIGHAMARMLEPGNVTAYIGPHIGYNSFQVNESIALDIMLAQNLSWKQVFSRDLVKKSYLRPKHLFMNLQGILKFQLNELGVKQVITTNIDTCTSPHHFSHRRNPNRNGTNYSFIAIQ